MSEWTETDSSSGGQGPNLAGEYHGSPGEGRVINIGGNALFYFRVYVEGDSDWSWTSFDVDVHFTDGSTHSIELSDTTGGSETVYESIRQMFQMNKSLSVDSIEVVTLSSDPRSHRLDVMWGSY